MQHTYQGMIFGPLFLPTYGVEMIEELISPDGNGVKGPGNFMETGPYKPETIGQAPTVWP